MESKLRITAAAVCFALASCAGIGKDNMPKNFTIAMDGRVFSVAPPVPPENEFVKYSPVISLQDDKQFGTRGYVTALKLHWAYRSGIFQKVDGVMEMQVMPHAARQQDVKSLDGLKRQIAAELTGELKNLGSSFSNMEFDTVTINGRSWLKYPVRSIGVLEYSTSLSGNRYLAVQFAFIGNTGEESPAWRHDADQLVNELVGSMTIL
jgi:hypothetical protein